MKSFTVFAANGEFKYTTSVNGLGYLPPMEDSDTHVEGLFGGNSYLDNGAVLPIPERPSPIYTFDYTSKQWVDPRTLDQIKAAQWESIKASRATALTSPVQTPFGAFDATDSGQKSITDAVLMLQTLASLGTPMTIDFTLADNSVIALSTEQMVTVGLLLGQRTQQVYSQARLLRAAIEAAVDVNEVQLIVWA